MVKHYAEDKHIDRMRDGRIVNKEKLKNRIRRAMLNSRGDDLERAKAAFGKSTLEEMELEHGQSGKTRQQILNEYIEDRAEWNQANDLLEDLLR